MTKLSKQSVAFEHPAKGPHHCSECVHYLGGACDIVAGKIEPADWCEKFKEIRDMAKKPAVRKIVIGQKEVKDAKGKTQVRHTVTAHFHRKPSSGGKGAKAAFSMPSYQDPETTEHETADGALQGAKGLMNNMEPDGSGAMYPD
jgi:hypothetical protein